MRLPAVCVCKLEKVAVLQLDIVSSLADHTYRQDCTLICANHVFT